MSRERKHPDEELFNKYEAFHMLNLEWIQQFEEADGDEWTDGYNDLVLAQWDGMLRFMMQHEPKTPAGLALLALAVLHYPSMQLPDAEGYLEWDGYSVPSFLDKDDPTAAALAQIAAYALALAPEVAERSTAAEGASS